MNNQLCGLGLHLLGFEEKNWGQNYHLFETFISFLKLLYLLKKLKLIRNLFFLFIPVNTFSVLIQIWAFNKLHSVNKMYML